MIWSDDPRIEIFNEDCLPAMRRMKDNEFDLAIVDPPYGIGDDLRLYSGRKNYVCNKGWNDKIPDKEYFKQLFRVSKNQIIWGGNNFPLPRNYGWIFWDKQTGNNDFGDGELAWTSFNRPVRKFVFMWNGMLQENMKNKEHRIHPNQKPVALYKWLLKNYAKPGDRILDTHLGSGSIAIACWDMGFSLTGYELDEDYFKAAHERFKRHIKQGVLFR